MGNLLPDSSQTVIYDTVVAPRRKGWMKQLTQQYDEWTCELPAKSKSPDSKETDLDEYIAAQYSTTEINGKSFRLYACQLIILL